MPRECLSDVALGQRYCLRNKCNTTRRYTTPDKLRNHCPNMGAHIGTGHWTCLQCCPAPCTFKARAEGLAQLKPAQAASCVWCPHGRQRTDPTVFIAVDDLNLYYGNAGTAALALKYKTFRRKTYLPKACNFHVQMPGSRNCRMKHARRLFTRCGLGAALLAARWV